MRVVTLLAAKGIALADPANAALVTSSGRAGFNATSNGKSLNTVGDAPIPVQMDDLSANPIPVNVGENRPHQYRLSQSLNCDPWFDSKGHLAQVAFKAEDGSTVTCVRK